MQKFKLKQLEELNKKLEILRDASKSSSLEEKIYILRTLYTETGLKSLLNSGIMKAIICFKSESKDCFGCKNEIRE